MYKKKPTKINPALMTSCACLLTAASCTQIEPSAAFRSSIALKASIAKEVTDNEGMWPWKNLFKVVRVGHILGKQESRFYHYSDQLRVYNNQREDWDLFDAHVVPNNWSHVIDKESGLNTQLEAFGLSTLVDRTKIKGINFKAFGDKYNFVRSIPELENKLNNQELFPGILYNVKADGARLKQNTSLSEQNAQYWVVTGVARIKDLSIEINSTAGYHFSAKATEALQDFAGDLDIKKASITLSGNSTKTHHFSASDSQVIAIEVRPLIIREGAGTQTIRLGVGQVLTYPQ